MTPATRSRLEAEIEGTKMIPPTIKAAAEAAAKKLYNGYHQLTWHQGVEWLYAHLTKQAPEFDQGELLRRCGYDDDKTHDVTEEFLVKGAKAQHQQSAATIAALRADRDKEAATVDYLTKQTKEQHEEITRLKAELAEQCKQSGELANEIRVLHDHYGDCEQLRAELDAESERAKAWLEREK